MSSNTYFRLLSALKSKMDKREKKGAGITAGKPELTGLAGLTELEIYNPEPAETNSEFEPFISISIFLPTNNKQKE